MRLIPILALMTLTACGSTGDNQLLAASLAAELISMSSSTSASGTN